MNLSVFIATYTHNNKNIFKEMVNRGLSLEIHLESSVSHCTGAQSQLRLELSKILFKIDKN